MKKPPTKIGATIYIPGDLRPNEIELYLTALLAYCSKNPDNLEELFRWYITDTKNTDDSTAHRLSFRSHFFFETTHWRNFRRQLEASRG